MNRHNTGKEEKREERRRWWENHLPPGISVQRERKRLWIFWAVSLLYSLIFFLRLYLSVNRLYDTCYGQKRLISGAVMDRFTDVMGSSLILFLITIVCHLFLAGFYYLSFYQGSRSIYTMRRLPDRWELHRRCWTFPLISALTTWAIAMACLMIFLWIYGMVVPEGVPVPDPWEGIWQNISHWWNMQ